MKILIRGNKELDKFIMSLPFIKGLTILYPQAEVFIISRTHFSKVKDFAQYIHHFICDQSIIENIDFDMTIDLENLSNSIGHDKIDFDQVNIYENFHYTDKLLACLPKEFQQRNLNLSETVKGFEEFKGFAMRGARNDFDIVLYPFSHSTSNLSLSWKIEDFQMFTSYFFKMNPDKKILLLALESQKDEVEKFSKATNYPKDLLEIKITSLDGALSLLKRSAFVITANSPMKFLALNSETTLLEVNFNEVDFEKRCSYRSNSYVLNFKNRLKSKLIYTTNELVFDNNPHFLAYVVTCILDDDGEKLRWFSEKYNDLVDIYKTCLLQDIGLKLIPIHWSQVTMVKSLINISHRLQTLQIKNFRHAEELYYDIHDESDLTQDQILYDLGIIQKEIESLLQFFRTQTHFAIAIKIENVTYEKLDDIILGAILDQSRGQFGITDDKPSKLRNYIIDKLLVNLFFIRQVMNVSGQKLLESLPMTAAYYS